MKDIFLIIQIAISIFLVALILLQTKGVGLGRTFGGAGEFYKSKRGVEKIIFYLTLALTGAFLTSSILLLLSS